MNKQEAERYYDIKLINAYLRKHKAIARAVVEKDSFGDYRMKWKHDGGNLPETLKIVSEAKRLRDQLFAELRAKRTAEFMK